MDPSAQAFDPDAVLAHDRYVRALARGLVRDAHAAEDVVQQTWLATLLGRPRGDGVRAWLAATVRHLATKLRLAEVRRWRRERLAARDERLPSAAELHERVATRDLVLQAVLALEEPYRTTLALRYLDGLPPRAIARRMDVPVATVRTRVRRGLERLRALLDERSGGDRAAWCSALAALARPEPGLAGLVPLLVGALLVTTKTKLTLVALAGVVLSLVLGRIAFGPAADSGAQSPDRPSAVPAARMDRPAPEIAREPLASRAAASAAAALPAATGALLVRVLWQDGARPAAGVAMRVQSQDADEPLFAVREAVTDERGEARLATMPSGGTGVVLDRGVRGSTTIAAGQTAELVLRLPAGLDVEGLVVDAAEARVAGAEVLLTDPHAIHTRGLRVATTDAAGAFALRGVPADSRLEARAAQHGPSPRLPLAAGEDGRARIRIVLADPGGDVAGVVRAPDGKPIEGAFVQVGQPARSFRQLPDGTSAPSPSVPRARTDREGTFKIAGVEAGKRALLVRAPGLAPFAGEVLVLAARETWKAIDVTEGVSVEGTITDPAGAPVPGVSVSVGVVPSASDQLEATTVRSRADGTYALRGLAPGPFEVLVGSDVGLDARGFAPARTRLVGHAGERLRWDVRLAAGLSIRGRVVDERGEPVAGATVQATGGYISFTRTGADGRFKLPNCKDAPSLVEVKPGRSDRYPRAWVPDVRPGPEELLIRLGQQGAPTARIHGRLVDPDGQPVAGASGGAYHLVLGVRAPGAVDPGTGRFDLTELPQGPWRLHFALGGKASLLGATRELAPGETWDAGDIVVAKPGSLRVTARRADGALVARAAYRIQTPDCSFLTGGDIVAGNAVATGLPPGKVNLIAELDGHALAFAACEVPGGGEGRAELVLAAGTGCWVQFRLPGTNWTQFLRATVRDATGRVVVDEWLLGARETVRDWKPLLPPGKYVVDGSTQSGWRGSASFVVGDAPAADATVVELR